MFSTDFNLQKIKDLELEIAKLKQTLYDKRHDFDIGMREGIQWTMHNYCSNTHDVATKSSLEYIRELKARIG